MYYFSIDIKYIPKTKIVKPFIELEWPELSKVAEKWIGFNPVWLGVDCVKITGYMNKNKKDHVLFAFSDIRKHIRTCYATWEIILVINGEVDNEKQRRNLLKRLHNPTPGVPIQACVKRLELKTANWVAVRSKRMQAKVRKLGFKAKVLHTTDIKNMDIEGYPAKGYQTPKGLSSEFYEKYAEKDLCDQCPSETCWECY